MNAQGENVDNQNKRRRISYNQSEVLRLNISQNDGNNSNDSIDVSYVEELERFSSNLLHLLSNARQKQKVEMTIPFRSTTSGRTASAVSPSCVSYPYKEMCSKSGINGTNCNGLDSARHKTNKADDTQKRILQCTNSTCYAYNQEDEIQSLRNNGINGRRLSHHGLDSAGHDTSMANDQHNPNTESAVSPCCVSYPYKETCSKIGINGTLCNGLDSARHKTNKADDTQKRILQCSNSICYASNQEDGEQILSNNGINGRRLPNHVLDSAGHDTSMANGQQNPITESTGSFRCDVYANVEGSRTSGANECTHSNYELNSAHKSRNKTGDRHTRIVQSIDSAYCVPYPGENIPSTNRIDGNRRSNHGFESERHETHKANDRYKKDKHNNVERRRRTNINDKIKELTTLLPGNSGRASFKKKSSILEESIDNIKNMKSELSRLKQLEDKMKETDTQLHKFGFKIKQMQSAISFLQRDKEKCYPVENKTITQETTFISNQTLSPTTEIHRGDCNSAVIEYRSDNLALSNMLQSDETLGNSAMLLSGGSEIDTGSLEFSYLDAIHN